ncbi:MAG TPA: amidase [Actinomycetota bacterium]|nr:amidase [Actinomycetota bacterium]
MSLADLSLEDASRAVADGAVSCVELARDCLARIHSLDAALRAWEAVDDEGAETAAAALDREPARGRLHGMPIAVKDIIDVAGLPTTASSRVLAGNVASHDAPIVARLRAGGAIVLGKTTTHEFADGVVCSPTRNPWDTERIPGGSSGGSAVALAARMAPGALGTDTAGSIRIPAALCGVSGLVPTRGAVPADGIVPLSRSLDVCGPMARSVRDLALLWEAMAGPVPGPPEPALLSVGIPERPVVDLHPSVAAAVEAVGDVLGGAGLSLRIVSLRRFEEWDRARGILLGVEALAAHREAGWYPDRAHLYTEETRRDLRDFERIPADRFVAARRRLDDLVAELGEALSGIDLLLLPGAPRPAPTRAEAERLEDGGRPPALQELVRLNGPINAAGLASIAFPCGYDERGLPLGAQLVARDEATALAAGALFQELTDHHSRRPPEIPVPGGVNCA